MPGSSDQFTSIVIASEVKQSRANIISGLAYKPHLPRNYTEKPGPDHKLHAGTAIICKVVNSRSRKALCFSVFPVFPWLK